MNGNFIKFADLATSYFPGCSTTKNAVRSLMRYIVRCSPLHDALKQTGFGPYNHRWLSPLQVDLLFRHLGDPYDD